MQFAHFARYDPKGNTINLSLLDFQTSRVSSPAVDLAYALTTGTQGDLRMKHWKEWIKIYHDKFTSDMAAFGYDATSVYPVDDLIKDYEHFYHYAFVWGMQHSAVRAIEN